MSPAQTTALKWSFFADCCMLLALVRQLLLGSLTIWGALPFLPPVILAVIASFEPVRPAVIFGLAYGAVCDLALPAAFPCLYTLAFTLAALLVSSLSSSVLQPGFPRALLMTVVTFFVVDCFNAAAIALRGAGALLPMLSLFVRETLVSCLLLVPVYPLLRAVRRIFPE